MSKSLRIINGENEKEYYDLDFNTDSTFFELKQELIRLYGAKLGITEPSKIDLFIKNGWLGGNLDCPDNEQIKDYILTTPGSKNIYHFSINHNTNSSTSSPLGTSGVRLDPWSDNVVASPTLSTSSWGFDTETDNTWDITDNVPGSGNWNDSPSYTSKYATPSSALLGSHDESEFLLIGNSALGGIPVLGVARNSGESGVIDVTETNIHCGFIGLPKQDGSIDLYILWSTNNFDPAQFMYRYAKFYLDHFNRPFIATVDTPARDKIGMNHYGDWHTDHLITITGSTASYATPDLVTFIQKLLKDNSGHEGPESHKNEISDYVLLDYKSKNGECVGTQYQCGIKTTEKGDTRVMPAFFRGKMTSSDTTSSTFMFNNTLGEHCTPCEYDYKECSAELQECRNVGNVMIEKMYYSNPDLVKRNLRRYELIWLKKNPTDLQSILDSKFKKMTFTKAQIDDDRCPTVIHVPEDQTLSDFIETPDMLRRQIGGIIYKKTRKHKSKKQQSKKQQSKNQNNKKHKSKKQHKKNKSRKIIVKI